MSMRIFSQTLLDSVPNGRVKFLGKPLEEIQLINWSCSTVMLDND